MTFIDEGEKIVDNPKAHPVLEPDAGDPLVVQPHTIGTFMIKQHEFVVFPVNNGGMTP